VQEIGRVLLLVAAALAVAGVLFLVAGRLGLGRLPGDLVIRGRHLTVYLPIVTSILLSLLLTGVLWLLAGRKR
jgi:hypothetical protein